MSAYRPVEAAVKVLSLIPVLAGNELTGLTPGQLSKALDISPAQIGHYLVTLQEAGFAEPLGDSGRWRLGPRLVQVAIAFMTHVDAQEKLVAETKQRYSRNPS